ENSYPTIAGGRRVDEMEKCGHYRHWREDLQLTAAMDIRHLRWGPALYRTLQAPGRYDLAWTDHVVGAMGQLDIEPIFDLCHFGLPDWLGNFQNREFPEHFAAYAGACAARYPHIRHWTPVNEILITALFSAKYGWWNERMTTERSFTRAILNLCRANVLAMRAIQAEIPGATFVQSESLEVTHASDPSLLEAADFENERRFLPLDLSYNRPLSDRMLDHLDRHGMAPGEYDFFQDASDNFDCILGTDYYVTNEHLLHMDGSTSPSGEYFGFYLLAKEYYERYGLPLMHTETNLKEEEGSVHWMRKQWNALMRLRRDGIPIQGFTWFSLTDQIDWDTALRDDAGRVNSVGLFDLDRNIRPAGREYQDIIQRWSGVLADDSVVVAPHLAA
ncbi:MAG TPA: family 1 glycosylhydrolase, partial [Lacipirellulaceae bacterium]|nr:family 1 glycosylhydrolase [Lacipirellulaceae bacterium]